MTPSNSTTVVDDPLLEGDTNFHDLPEDAKVEVSDIVRKYQDDPEKAHKIKLLYLQRASALEQQVDELAKEVHLRQKQMQFLNEVIIGINNVTDEKNCFQFEDNSELAMKLQAAAEFGIKIKDGKTKYNQEEKDILIGSIYLLSDNWDKENRYQIQKMENCVRDYDRFLIMARDLQKREERVVQVTTTGMRQH